MENNESLNFLSGIIEEWGGEKYAEDPVGTYADQYPTNSILIDVFPYTIKDPDKYHQVSIFYRKWIDRDITSRTYRSFEKRYLDFLKTVWLYNRVDMSYCLSFDNYFRKGSSKKWLFNHRVPIERTQRNVTDWCSIKEVISLALREAGFLWLYFQDWKMLAVINDFSIQLLVKEQETFNLVSPLLVSNHLYSRLSSDTV